MLAFGLEGPCHARNKGHFRLQENTVHTIWQSVCYVVVLKLYCMSLVVYGKPSLSDVQELEPCSPSGLSCYARNHSDSFNCTTQVFYLLEY